MFKLELIFLITCILGKILFFLDRPDYFFWMILVIFGDFPVHVQKNRFFNAKYESFWPLLWFLNVDDRTFIFVTFQCVFFCGVFRSLWKIPACLQKSSSFYVKKNPFWPQGCIFKSQWPARSFVVLIIRKNQIRNNVKVFWKGWVSDGCQKVYQQIKIFWLLL